MTTEIKKEIIFMIKEKRWHYKIGPKFINRIDEFKFLALDDVFLQFLLILLSSRNWCILLSFCHTYYVVYFI